MAVASRRISIGFQGGQVLALRVTDEQLQALHAALGDGGWHELETEDGPCGWTSARSSTCAPSTTTSASASEPDAAEAALVARRAAAARVAHALATTAARRARRWRASRGSASTARSGWRSARRAALIDRRAPRSLAARAGAVAAGTTR